MSMSVGAKLMIIVIALAIVGGGVYFYVSKPAADQVACTQEAKLCPDGSYVGRTGPHCEFAACPGASSATGTTTSNGGASGINGMVLLGPTCPVQRNPPDPNCADKPFSTLVAIFRASDPVHAVVITQSDAGGSFTASVPPGDYTVGAGESNLPRCDHPTVTVPANRYATVTVSCDTGIR